MKEAPTQKPKNRERISKRKEDFKAKPTLSEINKKNDQLIEQLKSEENSDEQLKTLDELSTRITELINSRKIDQIDTGIRLAFMVRFRTQKKQSSDVIQKGENIFRNAEETVLNRFKKKPKLIKKYIDKTKKSSIPLSEKDPEERNADIWAVEISQEIMEKTKYEELYELIDKEGEKAHIKINTNGEKWEIHFLFHEANYDFIQIQNKDSEVKRMIYSKELKKRIQSGTMEEFLEEIKAQSDVDRSTLEEYELPKGKDKTLFQYFVPSSYDEAYASSLMAMIAQRALLEENHDISVPPIYFFGENAKESFDQYVKEARNKGFDTVHMEIISHGNEEGFEAYASTSTEGLPALEFYQTLGAIEGININISTNACHGAGLTEAYEVAKKYSPQLVDQINIFTQTKPDIVNLSINKKQGLERSATYYQIFMLEALLQGGISYGEAVNYADQRTRTYSSLDAESIIDGEKVD
jgi:hypothetical protein